MNTILSDVSSLVLDKINIDDLNHENYISTQNMIPNRGGIKSADKLPSTNSVRKFLKNDILISNIRPYFKKIWFSNREGGCSNDILVLRANDNIIPRFLYYILSSDDFFNYMTSTSKGTKMPRGDKQAIMEYSMFIPPLEIQFKIVYLLSNLEKKLSLLKQINQNLEEIAFLIFKHYFIDCVPFKNEEFKIIEWGEVPTSWDEIELGEIMEIISGKRPGEKSDLNTSKFTIPIYGASGIMGYTDDYLFNEKIIVIGRVGTHGVIQRINSKSFPSDNSFVLKSPYYNFLYQILKRIDYSSLNVGSTQPLLTQKSLKKIKVVLPPKNILNDYELFSQSLFDKIDKNNAEIEKLTQLRDTLLPKLMSGEIDVSKIEV